jgi:hypothetical protein
MFVDVIPESSGQAEERWFLAVALPPVTSLVEYLRRVSIHLHCILASGRVHELLLGHLLDFQSTEV